MRLKRCEIWSHLSDGVGKTELGAAATTFANWPISTKLFHTFDLQCISVAILNLHVFISPPPPPSEIFSYLGSKPQWSVTDWNGELSVNFCFFKIFFLSKTFRLSLYCLLMKGLSLITLGWNAIWQNSGWPAIFLTWVFPKSAKRGTQGCSGCRWVGWKRIPRTGNIDVCFLLPLPLLLLLACVCSGNRLGKGCTGKQIAHPQSLSKGPQMICCANMFIGLCEIGQKKASESSLLASDAQGGSICNWGWKNARELIEPASKCILWSPTPSIGGGESDKWEGQLIIQNEKVHSEYKFE